MSTYQHYPSVGYRRFLLDISKWSYWNSPCSSFGIM